MSVARFWTYRVGRYLMRSANVLPSRMRQPSRLDAAWSSLEEGSHGGILEAVKYSLQAAWD